MLSSASFSVLPKLPQASPIPAKHEPIWTACQGDTPALRFGNADTPPPASPAATDATPQPTTDATPTEITPAPANDAAAEYKLETPAPAADTFTPQAAEAKAPEVKPAVAKATAKKAPLGQRIGRRIKQITWGLFGLSTLAAVGSPAVFFNTKPTPALVQADQSAKLWGEVTGHEFKSTMPAIQETALEVYMADLLAKSTQATPGQQPIKLTNAFTLGEKEHQILAALVEQGKTAETWQDTLALYNRFADEYLTQYNSKESVDASKKVVGDFFAANAEQLSDRSARNHLMLMVFLYGLGGATVSGAGLLTAKRLAKTPKIS